MASKFVIEKLPGGKWRVASLIGSALHDVRSVSYADLLPEIVKRSEKIVDGTWQPPIVPKVIIK